MTTFPKLIAITAVLGTSLLFVPAVAASVSDAFTGAAGTTDEPGTIALRGTQVDGLALGTAGMLPGDAVTGAVELRNDGDAELRYAVTTSAVDQAANGAQLSSVLAVTVRTADVGATNEDPCHDHSGTVLLAGANLGTGRLLGDSSMGADDGDRTLGADAEEILCFTVELPITAGNEFQGASSTISFGFTSEATASNP